MIEVDFTAKDSETVSKLRDIGKNPATPVHVLEELASHPRPSVKFGVAKNPNAPQFLLKQLLNDPAAKTYPVLATHLAANPGLGAELCETLSHNQDYMVRCMIARNEATPIKVLERLLHDEDTLVRRYSAEHGKFGNKRVRSFAMSDDFALRFGAIGNRNVDFKTLYGLSQDLHREVRLVATQAIARVDEDFFRTGLVESGYEDLVDLPRKWVLEALGVTG